MVILFLSTYYQIHGFPDKSAKKSGTSLSTSTTFASQLTLEQYNKLLALLAKEEYGGSSIHLGGTTLTYLSSSWIIDFGVFNHICTSLSFFPSHSIFRRSVSVQLLDGSQASVTHIGTVHCSSSLILVIVFHI